MVATSSTVYALPPNATIYNSYTYWEESEENVGDSNEILLNPVNPQPEEWPGRLSSTVMPEPTASMSIKKTVLDNYETEQDATKFVMEPLLKFCLVPLMDSGVNRWHCMQVIDVYTSGTGVMYSTRDTNGVCFKITKADLWSERIVGITQAQYLAGLYHGSAIQQTKRPAVGKKLRGLASEFNDATLIEAGIPIPSASEKLKRKYEVMNSNFEFIKTSENASNSVQTAREVEQFLSEQFNVSGGDRTHQNQVSAEPIRSVVSKSTFMPTLQAVKAATNLLQERHKVSIPTGTLGVVISRSYWFQWWNTLVLQPA